MKEQLAEEFRKYKDNSIKSYLHMGKVLDTAKQQLEQGEFHHWLKDSRVNVSIRTAQRLMMVYRNFQHLLDDNSHFLSELDISHLLELRNVPQRFKKSIDVGEDKVDVVDEVKVIDFLNKSISKKGKIVKVKDLPLGEFKQQIMEVGGEYKDLAQNENKDVDSPEPVAIKTGYDALFQAITSFFNNNQEIIKGVDKIDEATLFEMTPDDKERLKQEFDRLKESCTAIIVKVGDKEDML